MLGKPLSSLRNVKRGFPRMLANQVLQPYPKSHILSHTLLCDLGYDVLTCGKQGEVEVQSIKLLIMFKENKELES